MNDYRRARLLLSKCYSDVNPELRQKIVEFFAEAEVSNPSAGAELTTEALDTQAKIEQAYQAGWKECEEAIRALVDAERVGDYTGNVCRRCGGAMWLPSNRIEKCEVCNLPVHDGPGVAADVPRPGLMDECTQCGQKPDEQVETWHAIGEEAMQDTPDGTCGDCGTVHRAWEPCRREGGGEQRGSRLGPNRAGEATGARSPLPSSFDVAAAGRRAAEEDNCGTYEEWERLMARRTRDSLAATDSASLATPGANAEDHGPTCADTPVDHRCGDTEGDQGVSWREMTKMYSERIRIAGDLHVNTDAGGGATTGYCCSCGDPFPCQTAHVLNGWGMGDGDDGGDCYVTGYCTHAGTTVEKIYESDVSQGVPTERHSSYERHPQCVENWPDCVDGEYNPACCRFPKSCSCAAPDSGAGS